MANAMAIFAAQRGLQAGQGVSDAYKQKLFSELQADALGIQMQEISRRAEIEIGQVFAKGERVQAEQTAAFIKGGVTLEGSSMEVLANTMSNVAEAALIRRREADFQLIGLAGEQASLEESASDLNFFLNSAAGIGSAYAGFKVDEARNAKGVR